MHSLKSKINVWVTLAFPAIIILRDGFLLKEIFDHAQDVSIIIVTEIEAVVPGVIEGDGLVGAGSADYLR